MNFEPRNLLVTGGAGFIGSNFSYYWLRHNLSCRVTVFDALTYAGHRENLSALEADTRFHFVQGDICDDVAVRSVMEQQQIDTIVHFAAESHVDRSILGPDEFIRTNVFGTHALLKVAKSLWIDRKSVPSHRFHHVSTDEVFGTLGPNSPAFHERTPYAPNSPYSASKAGSDHLVRAYFETYGLNTTLTNCSNNYGPYHFPEKLIPLTIVNILQGKALPVYGDGMQIRDWLHVEDHCAAIALALRRGRPGEVYNVGGNGETTNIEVVRTLCRTVDAVLRERPDLREMFSASPAAQGSSSIGLIQHVRDRPGHDRRYAIDFRKAQRELGYAPQRDLLEGLRETVAWFMANPSWWQALLGQEKAWIDANYTRR